MINDCCVSSFGMIECPKDFLFKAEISLWKKGKEEIMIRYGQLLSETVFYLSRRGTVFFL